MPLTSLLVNTRSPKSHLGGRSAHTYLFTALLHIQPLTDARVSPLPLGYKVCDSITASEEGAPTRGVGRGGGRCWDRWADVVGGRG